MLTRDEYESYLKSLDSVAKDASKDLDRIWQNLDKSNPISTRDELLEELYGQVPVFADEAATLAAEFYEKLRLDFSVAHFNAQLALFAEYDVLTTSIKAALDPLFQDGDSSKSKKNVAAVVERSILRQASKTINLNANSEKPKAQCASIPRPGCVCKFCLWFAAMGFGFPYRDSAKSYDGVWHDNCRCQLVPGFGKKPSLDWYNPERYAKLLRYLEDGAISVQKGAKPYEKELDVGIWIADAGHTVKFIKPTGKGRTADVHIDGIKREIKVPIGKSGAQSLGSKNVENQFANTVFPALQSENLIISHHKIGHLVNYQEWAVANLNQWEHWPQIKELWLVDSFGEISKYKRTQK